MSTAAVVIGTLRVKLKLKPLAWLGAKSFVASWSGELIVDGLYENTHVNKLCTGNLISNMHESLCQSKKQVMVIWNWSSDELCSPWASCFMIPHSYKRQIKAIYHKQERQLSLILGLSYSP